MSEQRYVHADGPMFVCVHGPRLSVFVARQHHKEGCNNLFDCTMNYLIGGMKGDSIDGMLDLEIPPALWRDPDMWARLALDISFYTIIPLVLLSIISGIIIDGFGELRDEQAEVCGSIYNFSVAVNGLMPLPDGLS